MHIKDIAKANDINSKLNKLSSLVGYIHNPISVRLTGDSLYQTVDISEPNKKLILTIIINQLKEEINKLSAEAESIGLITNDFSDDDEKSITKYWDDIDSNLGYFLPCTD